MKFTKKHLIIIALAAFLVIGAFVSVFPDPYHEKETVTFFEWAYREIHELIYGEVGGD